jgi:hypothetical protein
MKSIKSSTLLAGILALSFGTALARADQPAPPKKIEEPKPVAVQGLVLTEEGLQTYLKNLGYRFNVEKMGESTIYWIKVSREGVEYSVSFQISPNKEKIWAIVPLADIPEIDKASADRLAQFLELNDTIGPCYFRFNRGYKRLYMCRAMDNRAVTPDVFRDNLDRLVDRMVETRDAWQLKSWTEPVKVDAAMGK